MFRYLSLAVIVPLAGAALANPVTCSHGALSRNIEVVYADPGRAVPCEVIYDKPAEGGRQTLWRAGNEAGYCESKAAGLREKLERLGWSCGSAAATEAVGLEPEAAGS